MKKIYCKNCGTRIDYGGLDYSDVYKQLDKVLEKSGIKAKKSNISHYCSNCYAKGE